MTQFGQRHLRQSVPHITETPNMEDTGVHGSWDFRKVVDHRNWWETRVKSRSEESKGKPPVLGVKKLENSKKIWKHLEELVKSKI